MTHFKPHIEDLLNVVFLNVVNISVLGWLQSVLASIPVLVSAVVGLSVVGLNILKAIEIYRRIKSHKDESNTSKK